MIVNHRDTEARRKEIKCIKLNGMTELVSNLTMRNFFPLCRRVSVVRYSLVCLLCII